MSQSDLENAMGKPVYNYPGLEGCVASLKWLWETRFAAIAGDNPAFEAWSEHHLFHIHALISVYPFIQVH